MCSAVPLRPRGLVPALRCTDNSGSRRAALGRCQRALEGIRGACWKCRAGGLLEDPMDKPRLFLGSSGKQEKLLQALTRGLERHRERRTLDDILQSGDVDAGAPARAHPGSRFRGVRLCTGRLDDGSPPASSSLRRVKRRRAITSCSKPAFSAASWECAEPSFSMQGSEASERPPGPYMRALRRRDDAVRDEDRQPEDPESNRERGPHRAHRGLMVAVLLDGAHRKGAVRAEPPEDFARSQRRAGVVGPFMAGGWKPLGEILERGGEGEGKVFRHLLLLERRAAVGPECAAARRNRRDPTGIRRPRIRLLHDARGQGSAVNARTVRCLLARRSRRHGHSGRPRKSKAGGAHCGAADGMEVRQECLIDSFGAPNAGI